MKYKAGIIGCGNIGSMIDKGPGIKPFYTHAGAYYSSPKFQLTAACDIDPVKLKNFGQKWQVKNLYTDFRKMLEKEKLDILSVCTAKEQHYQIVKKLIEKGIKIIFCEKPFTGNVKKAEELVKLCTSNKVLLAINYTRRYTLGHQKVKKIITGGELGKIQTVNCLYTKGVINNGSHVINLLQFLFGKVKRIQALSPLTKNREIKADYDLDLLLYFNRGFYTMIKNLKAEYYSLFEIDILGTKGRIKITESGFDIKWYRVIVSKVFPGYRELDVKGREIKHGMEEAILRALDNIVSAKDKKSTLVSPGRDALVTLKIIDQAIKAAKEYKAM